jgi:hypothetical protein
MCTIHADSPTGVFSRVVQMVRQATPALPADYALSAICSLDLIVQVRRTHCFSQSAALTVVALPIRIKGSCHKRGTGVPFHIAGRWLPDGTTGGKAAQVPRPRVVRPATIHGATGGVS